MDGDTVYSERINQLDLRVAQDVRASAGIRLTPSLELFNVNNSDAIVTYVIDQRAERRRSCGPTASCRGG